MTRPSFEYESAYDGLVLGVDEAGMGCWAGPVFAAATFVPRDTAPSFLELICDSKQLTPSKREAIFERFHEAGILYGVGVATLEEIEHFNIRGAAGKAMARAVALVGVVPVVVLVDGVVAPLLPHPVKTIVKGDSKSYSIAAASIAAKVSKDRHMIQLAEEYPHYGWERNQGYGTPSHQEALRLHGVSPHHRRTYAPIRALLEQGL